ncbi:MAG: hypothetical protein A4E57_04576 [Syntrophorhabdaceae bacterium PtaU1.Bin034]|nr:MAG: hypothetical protein A4E57_04576 [Syntrophorhabdaceae bacterium PtaU1.Bin034]
MRGRGAGPGTEVACPQCGTKAPKERVSLASSRARTIAHQTTVRESKLGWRFP